MAQISPELQHRYGLLIGNIPDRVRKAIDTEELTDRLVMADDLIRKSQQATTPGEGRKLGEYARRVLDARPRAETEKIVVAKMAKAKALGNTPQADMLARQVRELLADNPPAVRRQGSKRTPVAKDSDDTSPGLIAVYDADGNLAYVIDPTSPDVTPLSDPRDAALGGAAAVSKAVQLVRQASRPAGTAKAKGNGQRVFYDAAGKVVGYANSAGIFIPRRPGR